MSLRGTCAGEGPLMADRFASQTKPSPEVSWPDSINHSSWLQSKVIVKTNDIGADSTSPPADREMSADAFRDE